MTFFKRPFIYLTTFLIIGIIIGRSFPSQNLAIILIGLGVILGFVTVRFRSRIGDYFLMYLLPILLGYFVLSINQNPSRTKIIEGTYLVQIDEFAPSDKAWKKSIARVKRGKHQDQKLLLYFNHAINTGDVLALHFDPIHISNKGNPGEFDAVSYWSNKGIFTMGFVSEHDYKLIQKGEGAGFFTRLRRTIKTYIHTTFTAEHAGVLDALLLGDKSDLSTETRQSFSSAGAMHVLAVSGLHVGIIMFLLMYVFQHLPLRMSRRTALVVTISIIWIYAVFTGMSPSVMRAALMFSILFGGQIIYRQSDSFNTLFFSAFILLVIDPALILDIGFQLSYLAVLGIILIYEPIRDLIYVPNKFLRKIWEGTAIGIAAQLFTFPLTLYYFHQFPNYFIISNLGVMIFAGILLAIGILTLTLKVIPGVNWLLAFCLGLLVNVFLFFIQFIEKLPGSVAYGFVLSGILVASIYLLYALFLLKTGRSLKIVGVVMLFAALIWIQFDRYERMNTSHLIVFNHKNPLIALKTGNQVAVFYQGAERKARRIINDYLKVYPASVEMCAVKGNKLLKTTQGKHSVELISEKDKLCLKLDEKTIDLIKGFHAKVSSADYLLSLSNLTNIEGGKSLSEGAFRIDLD